MKTSPIGRAALTAREGRRLKAYRDSVGIWTIGVGHTSMAGAPRVTPGLTITAEECDAIFARDLVQYEDAVNAAVKVPLAEHEFDALVSVCYNIGSAGFARSTMVRRLNARDRDGAADAILLWRKPAEIIDRRKGEFDQFRTPYAKALPKARRSDRIPVRAPALLESQKQIDTPAPKPPPPVLTSVNTPPATPAAPRGGLFIAALRFLQAFGRRA